MGFGATRAMVVGGMVGGGIFSVLGVVIETAGAWAWLSFVMAGVIALATGRNYVTLADKFREGGGEASWLEIVTVWGKLVVLLGLAGIGVWQFHPEALHYDGVDPGGLEGAVLGAASIFMAYEGFQLSTYDYEDIGSPRKTLRRATMCAIVAVIGVYVAVAPDSSSFRTRRYVGLICHAEAKCLTRNLDAAASNGPWLIGVQLASFYLGRKERVLSGISRTTRDHDTIRRWAEARGGRPARVPGTQQGGAGVIRLQFPESEGTNDLEPISWDDFFEKFDENKLALVYQEATSEGQVSRFNRIVSD